MHEKRYNAEIDRLRSPERVERLEVVRAIDLSLEGITVRTALDAGTGSGLFAEQLVRKKIAVTGIDANPKMVEAAQSLVPGAIFKQATVESLPFEDRSFDLIFLGVVLHEADDTKRALLECKRCTKKRVAALEWVYKEEDFGPPLEHRLDPKCVLEMATTAGFRESEVIMLRSLLLYRLTI